MDFLLVILIFVIGSAIGSFINVIIDRVYKDESVISGRSYCDWCKKKIAWYDLIPVISYFILSGRCRVCKKKLNIQYPVVEFANGLLFTFVYFNFRHQADTITLIFYLFTTACLLTVFVADLKYGLIYDLVVFAGSISSLLFLLITDYRSLPLSILAGFILGSLFLILVVLTRGKGMGEGDVKLVFWLGLLVGVPKFLLLLFLAFTIGGLVALVLLLFRVKKIGQTVPFGPFLATAAFLTLLFSDKIISFYLKLLLH